MRSTPAPEAGAMEVANDARFFVGVCLSEIVGKNFRASMSGGRSLVSVEPTTDGRSLHKGGHRQAMSTRTRGVHEDFPSIRETTGGGGKSEDP